MFRRSRNFPFVQKRKIAIVYSGLMEKCKNCPENKNCGQPPFSNTAYWGKGKTKFLCKHDPEIKQHEDYYQEKLMEKRRFGNEEIY